MFELPPKDDEGTRQALTVPIPFLREVSGLGDLVKGLTDALRIPQCGGCRERQERMNEAVQFRPIRWED
jgi:hypothetical protein